MHSMNDHEKPRQYTDSEMATSNTTGRLPVSVREILDDYYDASSFGGSVDAISAANAVLAEVGGDLPMQDQKFSTNDSFSKTQGVEGDAFPPDERPSSEGKNESDGLGSLVSQFQGSPFVCHREPQDPVEKDDYNDARAHSITPEPSKMIEKLEAARVCDKNEDSGNPRIDLLCTDRMNVPGEEHSDKAHKFSAFDGSGIEEEHSNEYSLGRHGISDTKSESVTSKAHNKRLQVCSEPNPDVSSVKPRPSTMKKPFLKRGTRKEPSALHRFESNRQNVHIHQHPQHNRGDNLKKEKLKELERMQEKQREDLKKRIERRQCAREEIRLRKKGCKVQVVDKLSKKERTTEHKTESRSNDHDDDSEKSSPMVDIETDVDTDLDSDSDSDSSSDGSNEQCHPTSKSEVKSTPQKCMNRKERNPMIRRRDAEVKKGRTVSKKKGNYSPIPRSGNKNESKCGKSNDIEFKSPELEEQWQVIKSMRKRQEAALRSAEMEREQARSWAASEREKLTKWREQQRSMIQKEKQRVINDAMVCQRRERKKKLEDRAAEATLVSQKQAREEIENLKSALQKQKIDADASKSRQRLNEKRLRDMVTERDQKITILQQDLEAIQERNSKLVKKRDELIKERDIQAAARKKKSKKKKFSKEKYSERSGEEEGSRKIMNESIEDNEMRKPDIDACLESTSSVVETDTKEEDIARENEGSECLHSSDISHSGNGSRNLDKNAIRVISSNQDLFDEPTEDWLQRHLNDLKMTHHSSTQVSECQSVGSKLSHCTPTKKGMYDPTKYHTQMETPQTEKSKASSVENNIHRLESNHLSRPQERRGADGRKIVTYKNGTQKEMLLDGTSIVRFTNGDIKTTYSNVGIVVYYYAESKASHTQHPDGTEVYEFVSGQTEKYYPDGRKDVQFPDGTTQIFYGSGGSEIVYADGLKVMESQTGSKQIMNF